MNDIKINILASGSKGNCVVISDSGHRLIIDAGISYNQYLDGMSYDYYETEALFISHEHGDHCNYLNEYLRNGVNSYIGPNFFKNIQYSVYNIFLNKYEIMERIFTDNYEIIPIKMYHDCENCGFKITTKSGIKILFFTDTGAIKYIDEQFDYIIGECNYIEEIIKDNYHNEKIPLVAYERIMSYHMGLEDLIFFLKNQDLSITKKIISIHSSKNNSNKDIIKNELQRFGKIVEVY